MKKHDAFTLIELLVVISIIALLVSILMPALNTARQQATGAVCLANQKTMALAWVMYYDDNDGMITNGSTSSFGDIRPWSYYPGNSAGMEPKYESIKNGTLYPYIETVESYHCPGDKRFNKPAVDPAYAPALGGYRSYSIPCGLFGNIGWGVAVAHRKASSIKHPAEKYVFIEEMDGRGGNWGAWALWPAGSSTALVPTGNWVDPLAVWHNDASTLGFCDGHAEIHRWLEKSTYDMCEQQRFYQEVYSDEEGVDLAYMQKGYAYKELE